MTAPSLGSVFPATFRVLVFMCALIWAVHASAGGLENFLQAIESLDQSIQEKIQDARGPAESDDQELLEEPDPESTAMPVSSKKNRIKAQPRVAKESVDTEEEEDEPNLISSEKIRLTPDTGSRERPAGRDSTPPPSAVSAAGGIDSENDPNSQPKPAPQTSKGADTERENYDGEQVEIVWLGSATDILEHYGASGGVRTLKVLWQVRLREGHRLNIVDADDRLVGQLVRLDNAGSTWTASQFGQIICPPGGLQYGGGASGVSVTGSPAGWIYYSLVDDDPLKVLLPDGAYYVYALDKSDGRPFWVKTPKIWYHDILAGFRWSVENSNPIPDEARDGMRVAVDLFQKNFRYFKGDYSTWDPEIRVAPDGQMSGSYMRLLPHSSPPKGLTNKCVSKTQRKASWSVDRHLEIKPSLKEVQKNWRPKYDNEANNLSVTANVEQPAIPGKFRFTLFEVTREKGWAMNAGDKEDDSLDLEFVDGPAWRRVPGPVDGWTIETNRTMTTATVMIKANDYGAWGKLKCAANVDGEWWPCKSEDGKEYVTIPRDEDENKIADFWEKNKEVFGDAAADDDDKPEGRELGDGFSNYEEYRGFQIDGTWQDTEPKKKDLFVHNDAAPKKDPIDAAIDLFEKASELTVHKIEADEYDEQRIVNFNRGEHQAITRNSKGQKGLHIVLVDDLGESVCGGAGGNFGGPNVAEQIQIVNSDHCGFGSSLPLTVVAHELGHGVNLYHPGFDVRGPLECAGFTAEQGGLFSGPEDNLMRYEGPSQQYVDGKCYDFPFHLDIKLGTAFVKKLGGDGINEGPLRKIEEEDGSEYWLPMAGDARCTGTLITNMSLNQDKITYPSGCGL